MRLPTLRQLQAMHWTDAWSILSAHERDELEVYDNETLTHPRGRAHARKLIREKLKRIQRFKVELGLE